MIDSLASPGIDLPSPTLSACLAELAAFLAAPTAARLTEEQRALSLGIARRLVGNAAARLDTAIDSDALWQDWLHGGLPGATALAAPCFARAEEHRWRQQSALRASPLPRPDIENSVDSAAVPAPDEAPNAVEQAYLALRIADRRRFDALGNPAIALADLDPDLLRALMLDIAAWRLVALGKDPACAAELGEKIRAALGERRAGIDAAAAAYHAALAEASGAAGVADAAALAIARHDWTVLVALAAVADHRRYSDMALGLLAAETAALPSLLAPLRIDRAALAPLEASLAMLPARAVAGQAGAGDAR